MLRGLAEETEAGTLLWNRGHGLAERTVDAAIKEWATGQGITATAAERYPAPLVGLQESRARALDAYRQLKDG